MLAQPLIDTDLYQQDVDSVRAWDARIQAIIPELGFGDWHSVAFNVTDVRKQRKKRIIFGTLVYRTAPQARPRSADIVAKVYGSDRGGAALRTLHQLWQAGFQPPSHYRVPQPYGYSPERGILVQGTAPGVAWADLLAADPRNIAQASAQPAAWLLRLQRCAVVGEIKSWERDVAVARTHAHDLIDAFPQLGSRLMPLMDQIAAQLPQWQLPLVPAHGDYHPKNVFLTAGHTTAIDFDTFGLREPAFDVGYAIGQLLIMSYLRLSDFAPGAIAAHAFWRRYERHGQAPWERVAVHVARTLLQSLHFDLVTLRNRRMDLLVLWPMLIDQSLHSPAPEFFQRLERSRTVEVGA